MELLGRNGAGGKASFLLFYYFASMP